MGLNKKVLGVIPARFESTRFPGKPLAIINGKPMLQWVIEACLKSEKLDKVLVATDNNEILDMVKSAGAESVMTDSDCPTGSDRVWQAVERSGFDHEIIVNIQGDEPLLKSETLDQLINPMLLDETIEMATLAREFQADDLKELQNQLGSTQTAKVVLNKANEAIYFSRFAIPYTRIKLEKGFSKDLSYKHIGLYAYKRDFLQKYCENGSCELEEMESLEQLRALYLGAKIKVVIVDSDSWGVDVPEDIVKIESLLKKR